MSDSSVVTVPPGMRPAAAERAVRMQLPGRVYIALPIEPEQAEGLYDLADDGDWESLGRAAIERFLRERGQ